MKFGFRRSLALTAVVCASLAALPVDAKTFRWANSGDVSSMDPYARQETFLLTFTQNIYDPLVRRDKDLKLEPALATKWGQIDKTTWFFDLRQGVKFSDGTPFTADDAVEARKEKNSDNVILVRAETTPEDIHGMEVAVGILTARGGMTSHAAVVTRGMGKCCVAGAGDIEPHHLEEDRVGALHAM